MSYGDSFGREADFRVRYRWLPPAPRGPIQRPFQHMRCNFAYAGDDLEQTGVYMIWPEFEDANGVPLPRTAEIPPEGTATMWIVHDQLGRHVHAARIRPGVRGYLVTGAHRFAEVEVIESLGLVVG